MMKSKNKKSLRTFTAITCAILLGISGVSAYAEDSVQNLEEKTSELQGEIKDLKSQLDATCAEMEEIAGKIASTKQAIADTQAQLEIAQFEEQSQYSDMKLRIKQIYESGDYGFIEYLCSANSMNDLLNKADYIETMSQYDRKKMSDLINVRVEIENTKTTLEDENGVLDDLQKSLTEKQSTLNQKIASASSELNDYSQQLARAKAAKKAAKAEKKRQEILRQQALQQQQNQNNSNTSGSGGGSSPSGSGNSSGGTYLGSFRISHYCPCSQCCGPYGGTTASGVKPVAGRTIAVDRRVISLGRQVSINGHVYTAEDTGGAIKGNRIDVFVSSHSEALRKGVYYAPVYLL